MSLLLTTEEKPTDSSILKNIDIAERVQRKTYTAKTNVSENNVSDLEEKITILQEKLEAVNERFRRADNVNTTAGSNVNLKTYNNLEQLHQNR